MLSAMTIGADIDASLPLRRSSRPASLEHLADPGDDPMAVRENMVFEDRAVRDRHWQGAHPFHRGL